MQNVEFGRRTGGNEPLGVNDAARAARYTVEVRDSAARVRMKAWIAAALVAWLCVGCAQRGTPTPRTDGNDITMYGTLDEGITFRK